MNTRMRAVMLGIAFAAVFSFPARAGGQDGGGQRSSGPVISGKVYNFEKIADGVYYSTSTSLMATGGNHTIVVGDRDVFLVDAGATAAAGRALLEDMKLITDKPVRWVVNTHFHWDHTNANSIFGPEVEIIGHEYVRHVIADLDVIHTEPFKTALANMPIQVDALKKQIGDEKDPAKRAGLEKQLAAKQADWEEFKMLKPTPPNVTYTSKMTLYQGNREIRLLFLGRGHTQGDTIVYLPKERIVCTGDMMETQPAYMGSAMFDEWIKTLDAVKELEFDTALPGHGVPFHEKSLITAYQSYLRDFMSQVTELRKQGLTPEEAAKKVDMTSHKGDFPQIQAAGAEIRGVRRMYEWMDERGH
ncbi:MAG TPA: MBL fold metallo-hydrolase [Candidatus Acidoferrales bacterium]|nr:MBL fold metallo-hydrolase [Candidatus Acidoferrales bacterium]